MAASESNPIIFYDIKSAAESPGAKAWSPNTWKVRTALNYKRLPYRTIYLPYPEIAPTLRGLGLQPLEGQVGWRAFTLPVIIDPTPSGPPKIIRDSAAIAQYLDATYPDHERPLYPGGSHALQALFCHHFHTRIYPILQLLIVPLTPSILDEGSIEYFHRTRSEAWGKPFAEHRPRGADLDKTWESLKEEFGVLDSLLQKNEVGRGGVGGDYVMGDKFSFADCVLVACFVWIDKIMAKQDVEENGWERIKGWHNGRWERLWEKSEEYMQVD
ncbi:hypothetical protein BOTBODRAFT_105044 [Botryobasidium botryosum FD-172 SS1]|uniref:GST N-terminal domain-containing protein n=1 Tax=Botryobasidium botryosum (strain FD-172 SS1) TaxID=930990 RepID=A0A067MQ46_BOTB1|nr:hypothetical protein BOTBODRAFT_105044 [Botryobasidium botryosum FD-172 SS1]